MQSDRLLTAGLIDYAGLFPPAGLGMAEAARNYAEYLGGQEAEMLGRFVLPASRLSEFEETAADLLPRGAGADPWKVAVLLTDSFADEIPRILKFNCSHWADSPSGHAVIDVIEMKASTQATIQGLRTSLPEFYRAFIELSVTERFTELLDATRAANFSAKIRTGGVEPAAFPAASAIVTFMEECLARGLAFKATAGLHHMVCSTYPLTYEAGSASAPMFGFLNLFAAAVFLKSGTTQADVLAIMEENEAHAFVFTEEGMRWRGLEATNAQIQEARTEFAISFGSCSFNEPVEELSRLTTSTPST
ncbi:MAG: hypothetical protein H0U64_03355 [Gemmatimonadaceae bacterium]|nr:hypothetical protein [Gemmatimonadaceae bacterium]